MKRLKRFLESSIFDEEIRELQDLCVWLSDEVDRLNISQRGEVNGERRYSIDISFDLGETALSDIVGNMQRLNEVVKEYADLVQRIESVGYEVSYHLLETTVHLNFTSLRGKIQLSKR